MSISRQQPIRSLTVRYPPSHQIKWHVHDWSQLIYATEGVMTVSLPRGRWVVPTRTAINVQAGVKHRIDMHGSVFLQTVYFKRTSDRSVSDVVINISSLMHELIKHVCERGIIRPTTTPDRTLIRFFDQQLSAMEPVDSELLMPTDKRAVQFANQLLRDPGNTTSLSEVADRSGTSLRTMQRIFPSEVGLTVSQWRHRVRMLRAIERLAASESVTGVALDLGFESVSAFIHAFKKYFGVTPGKYRP